MAAGAAGAALVGLGAAAGAQEPLPVPVAEAPLAEPVAADEGAADQPAADPAPQAEGATAPPSEPNPDEMAADLNARQQIRQTFTFTRTIDGKVVETESRTVTYRPGDPERPSEAGPGAFEELAAAFNSELLTRTEAFEEARLDFVVGDLNRDEALDADEFVRLVETWRATAGRAAPADGEESARDRQYRAFLAEIDPEASRVAAEARARRKFAYMAGAATTLSREDYLREFLLDFDSMDGDADGMLRGEELLMFRALNKGETIAE